MIKPRSDYVVVKRAKPQQRSDGGIEFVLERDAGEQPAYGEVLAVGPGKRTKAGVIVPPTVKVGDAVLIGHYAGTTVRVNGEDVVMIREEEILGVMEDKA